MKQAFVTVATVLLGSLPMAAQSPSLRFEVASIKPYAEGSSNMRGGFCTGTDTSYAPMSGRVGGGGGSVTSQNPVPPGSCRFRATILRELIAAAYRIPRAELSRLIVGGPGWLDTDVFDIDAKADRIRPQQELEQMLQGLLAERFGLRLHRETRQVDGFALSVSARGPKLSVVDRPATPLSVREGQITAAAATMQGLAQHLGLRLDRPIVDDTSLAGRYAFALTWTPGEGEVSPFASMPPELRARMAGQTDPNGPSLTTALDEQLGLRLQPRRVPLEFLVIDAVERPTAN